MHYIPPMSFYKCLADICHNMQFKLKLCPMPSLRVMYVVAMLCVVFCIPVAFADHISATVLNTAGSSLPGCEDTDECFVPATVTIDVNGEVTWKNVDTASHTVTSGTAADGPDGIFDSGTFTPDKEFSHTFDTTGQYPYHCKVHPWMAGVVIVQESMGDTDTNDDSAPTHDTSGTYTLSDGTSVTIGTTEPISGEPMTIDITFKDSRHVNYDIVVIQDGTEILNALGAHHHGGSGSHVTNSLYTGGPIHITITFQGYGISDVTGPVGEIISHTKTTSMVSWGDPISEYTDVMDQIRLGDNTLYDLLMDCTAYYETDTVPFNATDGMSYCHTAILTYAQEFIDAYLKDAIPTNNESDTTAYTTIQNGNVHIPLLDRNENDYTWVFPMGVYESAVVQGRLQSALGQSPDVIPISLNGESFHAVDLSGFVNNGSFTGVVDEIYRNSNDNADFVWNLWHVVSQLDVDESYMYANSTGVYAIETLVRGSGDYEDLVILMADMLVSSEYTADWTIQYVYMDMYNPLDAQDVNHVILYVDDGMRDYYIDVTTLPNPNQYAGGVNGWHMDVVGE